MFGSWSRPKYTKFTPAQELRSKIKMARSHSLLSVYRIDNLGLRIPHLPFSPVLFYQDILLLSYNLQRLMQERCSRERYKGLQSGK